MKLIKLPDNTWIIINDEAIGLGDYCYSNIENHPVIALRHQIGDWDTHTSKVAKKIVASQTKLEGIPLIDIKQLEELLPNKEAYLDKRFEQLSGSNYYENHLLYNLVAKNPSEKVDLVYNIARSIFKDGYNEATKTYKYTEEDIRKAFDKGAELQMIHEAHCYSYEDFITSLNTPSKSEWDVTIEMEEYIEDFSGSDSVPIYEERPKVNKEGYINIIKIT